MATEKPDSLEHWEENLDMIEFSDARYSYNETSINDYNFINILC